MTKASISDATAVVGIATTELSRDSERTEYSLACEAIKAAVEDSGLGFDEIDRTRIEIVILELTRNILAHAGSGELLLELIEDGERRGMVVAAQDGGPGIADRSRQHPSGRAGLGPSSR